MNDEKSPTDAIINPLNELVDEKESEILEIKTGFLDDDAIAENVVISKIFSDDIDANKFQLLYIVDEVYYLIHYAENDAAAVVNTYNADVKPSELKKDTTLYKFMMQLLVI